jgi:hypothetical protein
VVQPPADDDAAAIVTHDRVTRWFQHHNVPIQTPDELHDVQLTLG